MLVIMISACLCSVEILVNPKEFFVMRVSSGNQTIVCVQLQFYCDHWCDAEAEEVLEDPLLLGQPRDEEDRFNPDLSAPGGVDLATQALKWMGKNMPHHEYKNKAPQLVRPFVINYAR